MRLFFIVWLQCVSHGLGALIIFAVYGCLSLYKWWNMDPRPKLLASASGSLAVGLLLAIPGNALGCLVAVWMCFKGHESFSFATSDFHMPPAVAMIISFFTVTPLAIQMIRNIFAPGNKKESKETKASADNPGEKG